MDCFNIIYWYIYRFLYWWYMRHKWKKIDNNDLYIIEKAKLYSVFKPMECIQCGLKKGLVKIDSFFNSNIVYFKNSKNRSTTEALSFGKLPYKCYEAPDSIFISEKDFMI